MSASRYVNERNGLPNLRRKLLRGEPVTVAFMGGSITEGYGASDPDVSSWRALTGHYLQEKYPSCGFTFINAGVGGTNSAFGAHRLQEHVLSRGEIDLLFVEFCVNDSQNREETDEGRKETIRGMEGIVRQCRRLSPRTDICFVYTADDRNLSEDRPFFVSVHEEITSHYGIPSVDFRAHIREWIASGEGSWEELAPDRVHPNDAGYARYASLLREYLEASLRPEAGDRAGADPLLPPPLDPGNYEFAGMIDPGKAHFAKEFNWRRLPPEPLINWRYDPEHLHADQPEAEITFIVSGRGAGLLLLCGPDTGIFEYSIDGSPWTQVNPFDEWCLHVYRPVIAVFLFGEERGGARVTVRNTAVKDGRSKGTGLRILKLLGH